MNKKAISLMVSYVLLIVIAMGLSAAVYSWLRVYATIPDDAGKCPEDTALIVKSYSCISSTTEISIKIQNKGLFNVDGFFIKATTNEEKIPDILLNRTDSYDPDPKTITPGRYDFQNFSNGEILALSPGQVVSANFTYQNADPLAIIQIQPFIKGARAISSCEKIINLKIESDTGCQ